MNLYENLTTCIDLFAWRRPEENHQRKSKLKAMKNKETTYVYLRPFIKSFLKSLKSKFKIILFSFKDLKLLEAIIHKINETLECELFDGYLSMPSTKKPKIIDINQLLSDEENRTKNNWIIIDSSPLSWSKNKPNCIPVTSFDGYCKDSTLFLWEKYIKSMIENSEEYSSVIHNSFYSK